MLTAPAPQPARPAPSRASLAPTVGGFALPSWFDRWSCRTAAPLLLQVTLLGAVLLPVAPLWGITLRLAAFAAAWRLARRVCGCNRRAVGWLLVAAAGLSLLALAELTRYLLLYPVGAVHQLLSSVHGLPLRWETGLALRLTDLVLVAALASFAWNRGRRNWPRLRRLVVLGLVAFAVWPVVASVAEVYRTSGAAPQVEVTAAFERNLAANTSQHFWVLAALLALLHTANRRRAERFCGLLAVAGGIQAVLVLAQHLVGDYSYVIEAPAIEDYFLRVKGTYYYHASADLFLLVAFFAALARAAGRKHTWSEWVTLGLILAALASNSTRAISLAMVAGGLTYACLLVGRSLSPARLGLAAAIVALFSTSILYEKGVSRRASEPAATATDTEAAHERDALQSLAESNRPRLSLLFSAAQVAVARPLTGSGPGHVSIPLDGRSLGGSLTTNSSHALLPDLVLGGGFPTMLAFVVLPCSLAGLALWRRWHGAASSPASQFAAAIVGLLAAFFVAALFLPQELNYTVGVFLAFCAVAVPAMSQATASTSTVPQKTPALSIGFRRWVAVPLTATAVLWVGLTSLSITAPIVEFAALHGRETAWPYSTRDPVYTTSPPLAFALRRVLPLVGCGDREVRLLADDPAQLPKCHSWVLWHPAYDKNYPNLRQSWPYLALRPYAVAPAYRLPAAWQVAPSQQLLVSFAWVGPWAHGVDPDEDSSDLQSFPPEGPHPLLGRANEQIAGAGRGTVVEPGDSAPSLDVDRHPDGHARYRLDLGAATAPAVRGPVVRSAAGRDVPRGIGPPSEDLFEGASLPPPDDAALAADRVVRAAYSSSTGWKQLRRVRTASALESGADESAVEFAEGRGDFADSDAPAEMFPPDDSQPLTGSSSGCGRRATAASQIVGYELTWAHSAEEVFRWQIELESLFGERMYLDDQHATSAGIIGVYRDLPRESRTGRIRAIFPEGMNAAAVRMRLFEGLMPDVASRVAAREERTADGAVSTVPLATDGNRGTAWVSQRSGPTALVFDLGPGPPTSIGLYGLAGVGFRDFDGANPTKWVLQGSADGRTWTDLDERSGQALPVAPGQMARYRVAAAAFRYYRLLLEAESYGRSGRLGLAELQLFPRM